jgi:hypothetical protein
VDEILAIAIKLEVNACLVAMQNQNAA